MRAIVSVRHTFDRIVVRTRAARPRVLELVGVRMQAAGVTGMHIATLSSRSGIARGARDEPRARPAEAVRQFAPEARRRAAALAS